MCTTYVSGHLKNTIINPISNRTGGNFSNLSQAGGPAEGDTFPLEFSPRIYSPGGGIFSVPIGQTVGIIVDNLCCENFNVDYSLDRVSDASLLEIWNGQTMSAVRKLHETHLFNNHPMCRVCDTWAENITSTTNDTLNGYKIIHKVSQDVYQRI